MEPIGYVEEINSNTVSGWAYNKSSPSDSIEVHLLDKDNNILIIQDANIPRKDLIKAGIGTGNHGFKIRIENNDHNKEIFIGVKTETGFTILPKLPKPKDEVEYKKTINPIIMQLTLKLRLNDAAELIKKEKYAPAWIALNAKNYEYNLISNDVVKNQIVEEDLPGVYDIQEKENELVISGVTHPKVGLIGIFANNHLIKIVNTEKSKTANNKRFSFSFKNACEHFDQETTFTVGSNAGPLAFISNHHNPTIFFPRGSGSYAAFVETLRIIDSHGNVVKLRSDDIEWQTAVLDWYQKGLYIFENVTNKKLFLIYGTLLGYERSRDFIEHDGDFDVAYLSNHNDPYSVAQETADIVASLAKEGINIEIVMQGGFFRPQFGTKFIDVFPLWFNNEKLWMHNTTCIEVPKSAIIPLRETKFKNQTTFIPNIPSIFLEKKYGENWRTPDPGYLPKAPPASVSIELAKSCITEDILEKIQNDLIEFAKTTGKKPGKIWRTKA